MKNIQGITNELTQALRIKYQNIINILTLVKVLKQQIQMIKNEGY